MSIRNSTFVLLMVLSTVTCDAMAIVPHTLDGPRPAVGKTARPALKSPSGGPDATFILGVASVGLVATCRLRERKNPSAAVGSFVSGLCGGAYGVLIGAWPLGLAVAGYGAARLLRWNRVRQARRSLFHPGRASTRAFNWEDSRMSRMFG